MKALFKDKRNILIILLAVLTLLRVPQEGARFLAWVLSGVLMSMAFDFLLWRTLYGKNIMPRSAAVSGFIVSGIIDYRQGWQWLIIFTLLAILSKHLFKFRKQHIFNPANFALFWAVIFKLALSWNIESNIFLIIVTGIYLAYSLKKIPHLLGFLILFTALFATLGLNPLGLVNWFFVFVMLIEPKTSGYGNLRGFVFGAITAVFSFLAFRFFPGYDFFISALFLANLCNPWLAKIKT